MWSFIRKYLGWRNWAVLQYNSIFENIFVIFYIALVTQNFSSAYLIDIILFIMFSVFSTSYGYLINDFADVDLDREHGKQNTFSNDSKTKAAGIVFLFLMISILFGLSFTDNYYFVGLWITWLIISTFYSLPPIRLKERGKLGLIFIVLAQRVIPILLMFAAFNFTIVWQMVLLGTYIIFRGLSSDVNHQLEDYYNDLKTSTKTFAVEMGNKIVRNVFRFSLEMEKILLAIILITFFINLIYLDIPLYGFLVLLGVLYLAAYLFSLYQIIKSKGKIEMNPFLPDQKNIFQFLHHSYPSVILGLGLNAILIRYNIYYLIILVLLMLIRRMYSLEFIKQSFIFQSIRKAIN